ncbi:MAG: monovalent cation/H(+) antiporter subunit G [Chloroflexia bacterium]|jgi:multicomponent Na+:H+ antiporter subunit G|nr:monovalent cation/H(+) antiporter subunit G [Chloroflexia bacterium]
MRPYVFDVLVIFGAILMTLGVIGMIRLPDVYTKLHGASKSVFLGVVVLAVSGMAVGGEAIFSRLLLICLALLITTPVTSHVVGRAAFLQHERMSTAGAVDESGSILPANESPPWRV